MSPKRKKRRKVGVVIAVVFALAVLLGIGVFAYFQANNIQALFMAKNTPEEQQELLIKNEEAIQDILNQLSIPSLQALNEEQEEQLKNGEITEEEALQLIMGKLIGEEKKESNRAPAAIEEPRENSKLQEKLAQIYLLRSSFSGRLDSLVAQAKQEYINREKGKDALSIAKKYLNQGAALEKQCDAQMEALLAEIKSELERTGGDTSLVSEIRGAYQSEKSVKKAALLSQYK